MENLFSVKVPGADTEKCKTVLGDIKSKGINVYLIYLKSFLCSASTDLLPSNRFPFSTYPHWFTEGCGLCVACQFATQRNCQDPILHIMQMRYSLSVRHTMNLNYFLDPDKAIHVIKCGHGT